MGIGEERMSLTMWLKNNSRMLGKGALYTVGGIAIGYPVLRAAKRVVLDGSDIELEARNACMDGIGVDPQTGTWFREKTKVAVIRTGLGCAAIYAARKL